MAKAARSTSEGFGSSVTENLKNGLSRLRAKEIREQPLAHERFEWQPFYKVFFQNIRDLISPPKLPPLKVTSQR